MFDLSFYKGKRVFVTGHTGFKGSWLCRVLEKAGAEVYAYSLEAPTTPSLSELSGVEFSADRKTATLSFGGIYPFNYISFTGRGKGNYQVSVFNGSRYEPLAEGELTRGGKTIVKLMTPIEDSYQIQVYSETSFGTSNEFEVKLDD